MTRSPLATPEPSTCLGEMYKVQTGGSCKSISRDFIVTDNMIVGSSLDYCFTQTGYGTLLCRMNYMCVACVYAFLAFQGVSISYLSHTART